MRKYSALILAIICLSLFSILLSSCGGSPRTLPLSGSGGEGKGTDPLPFGTKTGEYKNVESFSNGATVEIQTDGNGNPLTSSFGITYQCVEYVNKFYVQALGYTNMNGTGNAYDYYDNYVALGLERYQNGGTTPPLPADILVFSDTKNGCWNNTKPCGHMAIVREVTSGNVFVIQQNWSNNKDDSNYSFHMTVSNGTNYTIDVEGGVY